MLAGTLRAWRTERNWTQAKLAVHLNIMQATVSKWETGAKPIPDSVEARLVALAGTPEGFSRGHPRLPEDSSRGKEPEPQAAQKAAPVQDAADRSFWHQADGMFRRLGTDHLASLPSRKEQS